MLRRACVGTSAAVAVGLALAGCGSSSSSSSSAPSAAGATSGPAASPSAVLTGTQLGKALLPVGAMPSGYAADASGARNSGESTPGDLAQPASPGKVCSMLTASAWVQAGGISAGSFAQSDYLNSAKTGEIAQEVDAFTGTDARQVMTGLWNAFGKCATFTDSSGGTTATFTLKSSKLTGVGDQAIKGVQTADAFAGGATLVAIRVGNTIVTVLDSSPGTDDGSAAVRYAKAIAKNVQGIR